MTLRPALHIVWLGLAGMLALGSSTGFAATDITVTDDSAHIVTLKVPARRIISLAPRATELLFAAGTGERIVGISEYPTASAAACHHARLKTAVSGYRTARCRQFATPR